MKKIVLGLLLLVSFGYSSVKVGSTIISKGEYGCPNQREAIQAFDGVQKIDPYGTGDYLAKARLRGWMKTTTCKQIVYGLPMKIQKIENWGPKHNKNKYQVIMVSLPNNVYQWTILNE